MATATRYLRSPDLVCLAPKQSADAQGPAAVLPQGYYPNGQNLRPSAASAELR
jgi:hypothetical protein